MSAVGIKVLIIVTSHATLGTTGKPTGYYLPEVAHPYAALTERGITVDIASPQGGKAPLDPKSLDLRDKVTKDFWETTANRAKLENTIPLSVVKANDYQAILFAGGHGTMWDFAQDRQIQELTKNIYENGGFVAAVCHGPAALVEVKLSNGAYLVNGKKVAAFSNAEEDAAGLTEIMPFLLETELVKRGAVYSKANLWAKHVVIDGRLITGQNPASATEVGQELASALVP
jgi:putative intracellular protease/amidase